MAIGETGAVACSKLRKFVKNAKKKRLILSKINGTLIKWLRNGTNRDTILMRSFARIRKRSEYINSCRPRTEKLSFDDFERVMQIQEKRIKTKRTTGVKN